MGNVANPSVFLVSAWWPSHEMESIAFYILYTIDNDDAPTHGAAY